MSIDSAADEVNTLVKAEQELLGPEYQKKIILGGFGLGGGLAIHVGYRINPEIAGVFALSSFLPPDSVVFSVS